MQQQPLWPERILVEYISLFVWRDMHPVDKHLAVINLTIAFLQAYLALTYGFYLRSKKLNAGFYFFVDEKLVIRAFVLRENFYSFCRRHQKHSPLPSVFVFYRYSCP